jgi:hypothetical protein
VSIPQVTLQFRTPGSTFDTGVNIDMIDDTGAQILSLYETDLDDIINVSQAPAPFCYSGISTLIAGSVRTVTFVLEVALAVNGVAVTQWSRWPVGVHPGAPAGRPRLFGPYLRQMVYTATAPELPPRLCISSSAGGVKRLLPRRSQTKTTPRYWGILPLQGVSSEIPTGAD